jgi:hypothetical protein
MKIIDYGVIHTGVQCLRTAQWTLGDIILQSVRTNFVIA